MNRIALLFIALCLITFAIVGCEKAPQTNERLKLINIKLTQEEYAFAVRKENKRLVDNLNKFIDYMNKSGVYDAILRTYTEKGQEASKSGVEITKGEFIRTKGDLVVATCCPFEPFEYIGHDGKVYGIDMEIAQAFAKNQGLKLVVININFDEIIPAVVSGKADIGMAGITVTPERLTRCDFTTNYFKSSQMLVVDGKNSDFDLCKTEKDVKKVLLSLDKRAIGYQAGTTGQIYVAGDGTKKNRGFENVNPLPFKAPDLAIKALVSNEIYGCIIDEGPAESLVSTINLASIEDQMSSAFHGK